MISTREEFRKLVRSLHPTTRSKLRNLENDVINSGIKNTNPLKTWMINKGFYAELSLPFALTLTLKALGLSSNILLGNPEHSEFQMFKSYGKKLGKKRWHWRVYDFPEKIAITSELETDPLYNIEEHVLKDGILPKYESELKKLKELFPEIRIRTPKKYVIVLEK